MNSILIVDDNPDDREYLTRSLRRNAAIDHEVIEAQDETSCFEVLESGRKIDCILLDYSLPGQDGLKVLSHILDQDPYASVVMISGQGNEQVAVEAIKRGALDYFVKSAYPPSEMERSVLKAIRRTSAARRMEDQRENLRLIADLLVHDMKTPWSQVRESVERLTRDLPDDLASRRGSDLEIIRSGVRHMDSLIAALRDYTSNEWGDLRLEEVDLDAQLDLVRAELRSDLQAVNGHIECPERLPVVTGNGPQFARLLKNLIRNGIEHNRSDTPTVRITAREHAKRWSIDITDNGVGIDVDDLDRVFEPFGLVGRRAGHGGAGLGLAASRRIAERLGCVLSCSSLAGQGATFTLTVPKGSPAMSGRAGSAQTSLSAISHQFGGGHSDCH